MPTNKSHHYTIVVNWTGNSGTGTSSYRSYERQHEISASDGKPKILCSSDPAFRGDPMRWSPEELLVASLASCHQLWYLHLCAEAGVVVEEYTDAAVGIMMEDEDGSGRFEQVTLRPKVTISPDSNSNKAYDLHNAAHAKCFIANSVNFPVVCEPIIAVAQQLIS